MTAHPPHFSQSQRWILAVVLSGAGWTLLLIASMSESKFPLAAWSVFLWIAAATVVVWATIEHVSHREELKRAELTEVITRAVADAVVEAIVDEGLIQRLPKQRP